MNQALMAKHLWHLVKKKADSTWVAWIQQNRLKQQTIWSFHGFNGSWGWKKLLKLRNGFLTGVETKVGNGESFSLWLDPWHPDGPLIHKVLGGPRITGLSVDSWLNYCSSRVVELAFI
ncbi:UNVERIFIED_CONTAM: hypothetical protein Scaly_3103400 [Sesamum calycinum]|uniref:Reverse transcriptase zinc-binding domain-containing protein n=1 Tax=Sesamum calycinum TaxID=2727403 RepID=A0AAW2JPA2_9LAMI